MHSCLSLQDTLTTEHVQTPSPLSHSCLPCLWTIGSVFPVIQPLPFYSSSQLIPHSRSSSLWRSKWRQRSYLLFSSPLAKLALAASIASYGRLSSPSLWKASERSSCSFVELLSLQPEACLPSENKREALIINPNQGHCSHNTNPKASINTFSSSNFKNVLKKCLPHSHFHFHSYKTCSWAKCLCCSFTGDYEDTTVYKEMQHP